MRNSYALGNKIWLNSKNIKIKQNRTLKAQFFGRFQVLRLVDKQAYKIEFSKELKIYDVFYLSLQKQDTKKKKQVEIPVKLVKDNNDKNEIKAIHNSAVYICKSESNPPGLYYLVLKKGYFQEENT